MKITIPSFRQGVYLVSLSADVEQATYDAAAKESIKTGLMSSVDTAINKAAKRDVKRAEQTTAQLVEAFGKAKLKGVSNVQLVVIGDWTPTTETGLPTQEDKDKAALISKSEDMQKAFESFCDKYEIESPVDYDDVENVAVIRRKVRLAHDRAVLAANKPTF